MTERIATGAENERGSPWLRPSYWWNTVTTRTGAVNPTGWVRAFSTSDRSAPTHSAGTGHGRGTIAVGHGSLWVANWGSRSIARLEPRTLELAAIQSFSRAPVAIAAGPNAVWSVGSNGWLWRLGPDTQQAEGVSRLGRKATAIAVVGDLIWVLRKNGRLCGLEPVSGEVVAESKLPRGANHMVANDNALWVSCGRNRRVLRFNPERNELSAEIRLDQRIRCLVADDGMLLAGCARPFSRDEGWLHAIDCRTERVVSTARLPSQPRAIAADGKTAWVACGKGLDRDGTIERVDVDSGQSAEWRATDWAISSLALVDNVLLASMSLELAVPYESGHVVGAGAHGGGDHGGGHGGGH